MRTKSKFDPYIVEIAKYLSMGMSTNEIADLISYHFDDIVSIDALYTFIRARGLKSKVTQSGRNANYDIPKCDDCKDCIKVINTNEREVRLCLSERKIVSRSCLTSPMFCPKRPFDNEKKQEMLQELGVIYMG